MKPIITAKNQSSTKKSKIYAKYEKLLADIEKQKQFKINLQQGLRKAFGKANTELPPLIKENHILTRDYIIRLDELATEIGIGKFNREWIKPHMVDELDMLLDYFGHEDTILSNLHAKYSGVSLDDIANDEDIAAIAKSFSELLGFKVDAKEILLKGKDAFFEHYKQQVIENFKENRGDFFKTDNDEPALERDKKGSVKQTEETERLAKDARKIYISLVKKFHPDLETDPAIKNQNSEIIKQVTTAYNEKDFFSLLKLHISYIEDNEPNAETNADEMLKRYNKLLQKQLNELINSITEIHFSSETVIADFIDKNGNFSPQKFSAKRRFIEKENTALKATLTNSRKRPKGWFKDQMTMIKNVVQQNMMQDMFNNIFSDF